jgi:spermidine/putrescine-binding protein
MRRTGFTIGGLALFVCLTGCHKPVSGASADQISANAADEKLVNLYIWSDYLAPDTLSTFTEQTGIKVNVIYFDTFALPETRLLAGRTGFDVVVAAPPSFGDLLRVVHSNRSIKNYSRILSTSTQS